VYFVPQYSTGDFTLLSNSNYPLRKKSSNVYKSKISYNFYPIQFCSFYFSPSPVVVSRTAEVGWDKIKSKGKARTQDREGNKIVYLCSSHLENPYFIQNKSADDTLKGSRDDGLRNPEYDIVLGSFP